MCMGKAPDVNAVGGAWAGILYGDEAWGACGCEGGGGGTGCGGGGGGKLIVWQIGGCPGAGGGLIGKSWPLNGPKGCEPTLRPRFINNDRLYAAASLFRDEEVFFRRSFPVVPPINTSSLAQGSRVQ